MWHGSIAGNPGIAPAGRGARLVAVIVDLVLHAFALSPWLLLGLESVRDRAVESPTLPLLVFAAGAVTVLALAFINLHHLLARGQTLGKAALSIRIVDATDGSRTGFTRLILVRCLLNGVLGLIPGYLIVDALFVFARDRRCLHDRLAGTSVVRATRDASRWLWFDRVAAVACLGLGLTVSVTAATVREPTLPPRGPVVDVSSSWPGASVEEAEARLANPLETLGAAIPGAVGTRSRSTAGRASVELIFAGGIDPDLALGRTRDSLANSTLSLPGDAAPIELRLVGGTELTLSLTGDTDRRELSAVARRLAEQLEREPGVGDVETIGADSPGWLVELDEDRLMAIGLNALTVFETVEEALAERSEPDTLEMLVIARRGDGVPVRLSDAARIFKTDLGDGDGGGPAVSLRVRLASDAAAAALSTSIDARRDEIRESLPSFHLERVAAADRGEPPFVIHVLGDDLDALDRAAEEVRTRLLAVAGLIDVTHDVSATIPEIRLVQDAERMARLGVDSRSVDRVVALSTSGRDAGKLGNVPVRVRVGSSPGLEHIRLRTSAGPVPLTEITTATRTASRAHIRHLDGRRVVTITAAIGPGEDRRRVLSDARAALDAWSAHGVELREER